MTAAISRLQDCLQDCILSTYLLQDCILSSDQAKRLLHDVDALHFEVLKARFASDAQAKKIGQDSHEHQICSTTLMFRTAWEASKTLNALRVRLKTKVNDYAKGVTWIPTQTLRKILGIHK